MVLSCVASIVRCSLKLEDTRKSLYPDSIPLKVIKFASNAFDSHLCSIIIKDLEKNKYSEEGKTALIRPNLKKNEKKKEIIGQ